MSALTISAYLIATVLIIAACFIFYYIGKGFGRKLEQKNNPYKKYQALYSAELAKNKERRTAEIKKRMTDIKSFSADYDDLLTYTRKLLCEIASLREANRQKNIALARITKPTSSAVRYPIAQELINDSCAITNKRISHEA